MNTIFSGKVKYFVEIGSIFTKCFSTDNNLLFRPLIMKLSTETRLPFEFISLHKSVTKTHTFNLTADEEEERKRQGSCVLLCCD